MTSISNYLCQTLSSVARQIVGRPVFPTEIGRGVGGLIGSRPKYLDPMVDYEWQYPSVSICKYIPHHLTTIELSLDGTTLS